MTKPGKETPVFILQSRKELFIPKVSHLRVTLWGSQVSLTLLSVWVNRYTVHRFCFCRLGEHCNASKASLHRTQVWNPQIKWKITLITAASSAPMHHARQDGWRCSCSLLGKGLNSFFFFLTVSGALIIMASVLENHAQGSDTHSSKTKIQVSVLIIHY